MRWNGRYEGAQYPDMVPGSAVYLGANALADGVVDEGLYTPTQLTPEEVAFLKLAEEGALATSPVDAEAHLAEFKRRVGPKE